MKKVFRTYTDIKKYQSLTLLNRLRNYLFEGEIIKVGKKLVNEPVVDVRVVAPGLLLAEQMKDFKIRKSVAEKLVKINKRLRKNKLAVKVYEMHRSLEQQRKEFVQIKAEIREKNPGISEFELYIKTTEFIADPDLCPPHATGGAVDLTLVNLLTGKELEMGTLINSIDQKACLFEKSISAKAKANRKLLWEAMKKEKFAPMCTEWWHYSYGDAYWAAIYKTKQIYDKLNA